MKKFMIGDKVRYTGEIPWLNGEVGTVIGTDFDASCYAVEFDFDCSGHDCDGIGTKGRCYFADANDLELASWKIVLDAGARLPERAHDTDAGFDLFSRESQIVPAKGAAIFDTGVHIAIPFGFVGFLKSKSGLNVKHGITSDGTIDSGYTGSIAVKLYNHSDTDYIVEKGDKISQIVFQRFEAPLFEIVSSLEKTERGNGGFGSSGK